MKQFVQRFLPPFLLSWYHFAWAFLGAARYGFPSRKLIVVGVTGTNGKSSVVWMIARMLKAAGYRVAASSSIEFSVNEKARPNMHKMTMPGRMILQKFLADAVAAGCTHAVIEATSEGVAQHRHRFIAWDVMTLTNMSPEHIERHGSYERYREAKGELFQPLARKSRKAGVKTTRIVNFADREAGFFLQFPAGRTIVFRLADETPQAALSQGEEIIAEDVRVLPDGISFRVRGTTLQSPLRSRVNVFNALAAVSASYAVGVSFEDCARALAGMRAIPGRLEEVAVYRGARVIVDYAHNPTALRAFYVAARDSGKHLVCVLGAAGGGRDRWKRPELGKIAVHACDRIIVTDEDPYDEDPTAIRKAVIDGVKAAGGESRVEDISDRRLAIRHALKMSLPGGIVAISGKGSEPWMMLGHGGKRAWDDRQIVREEISRLSSRS